MKLDNNSSANLYAAVNKKGCSRNSDSALILQAVRQPASLLLCFSSKTKLVVEAK